MFVVPANLSHLLFNVFEFGCCLLKSAFEHKSLYEFEVIQYEIAVEDLLPNDLLSDKLLDSFKQSFEKVVIDLEHNRSYTRGDQFIEISTQSDPQFNTLLAVSAQLDFSQYLAKTVGHVLDVQFEVILVFEEFHMDSAHVAYQLYHL